jgi:hypothetical protein
MMGVRRRELGRRIAPVAVGIAVGALAGVALELAVPEPSRAPAVRAPALSPPDPALTRALVQLDQARVRDRAALGRARTPGEQAKLADRLADEHLVALTAVRGRDAAPLEDGLAAARQAYESLHEAATAGSAARYGAARQAVQAADTRLTSAVDDALRPQGDRLAAPPAVSRADEPRFSSLVGWAMIVAALGAGVVVGLGKPTRRLPAPPATAS